MARPRGWLSAFPASLTGSRIIVRRGSTRRPLEGGVPLQTLFATRVARAAQARAQAALLFNASFPVATIGGSAIRDRYAHFVNQAHPGPSAPLGWAQSRHSERELRAQLRQEKNRSALAEVRGWFAAARDGSVACADTR